MSSYDMPLEQLHAWATLLSFPQAYLMAIPFGRHPYLLAIVSDSLKGPLWRVKLCSWRGSVVNQMDAPFSWASSMALCVDLSTSTWTSTATASVGLCILLFLVKLLPLLCKYVCQGDYPASSHAEGIIWEAPWSPQNSGRVCWHSLGGWQYLGPQVVVVEQTISSASLMCCLSVKTGIWSCQILSSIGCRRAAMVAVVLIR